MEQNKSKHLRAILDTADGGEAELFVYLAPNPNGLAVIDCPGGGFRQLSADNEGHDFSDWFTERGITYCVLEYRLPDGQERRPAADIRAALEHVRKHSKAWGVKKIGVMGFSIGGYIAVTASTLFEKGERPNFQLLFYPVVSMTDELTHWPSRERLAGDDMEEDEQRRLSAELNVDESVPPTFIALNEDDQAVKPLGALRYYEALLDKGIKAELHIYPDGGHGFGFKDDYPHKARLLGQLEDFLKTL